MSALVKLHERIMTWRGHHRKKKRARNAEELREIYHEIDKLEKSKIEVQRYSRRYEDYQKYGLIALGALLLEILLRITIFRRIP